MRKQPVMGLILASLLAGLLLVAVQKNSPVTARESSPESFETIRVAPADLADEGPQDGLPQADLVIGPRTYRVEVAATGYQAQKGLMYRTSLPDGHGMLFPFAAPRHVSFWMKNTRIPLDMIFLRNQRVVHVVSNAVPCKREPCPTYPSVYPVDGVLELPAGTAKRDGIEPGAAVLLSKNSQEKIPQASGLAPVSAGK